MSDDLVAAIRDSIKRRGYPPSVRELAEEFGCSVGHMYKLLRDAENEGLIRRERGEKGFSRALRIVEGETP